MVLDAPELADDFYLNLVDWGLNNSLAVGLGNCVYLWNAANSNVTKLCDYSNEHDQITSVCWSESGISPSIGATRQRFFNELEECGYSLSGNLREEEQSASTVTASLPQAVKPVFSSSKNNLTSSSPINLPQPHQITSSTASSISATSTATSHSSEVLTSPTSITAMNNATSTAINLTARFDQSANASEGTLIPDMSVDESGNASTSDANNRLSHVSGTSTTRLLRTPSPSIRDKEENANSSSTTKSKQTSTSKLNPSTSKHSFQTNDSNKPEFDVSTVNHIDLIAIGTTKGNVQVWDTNTQTMIWNVKVHDQRVGALAWNGDLITSGSRDRTIGQFDIKFGQKSVRKFAGHKQEVCGLRCLGWSTIIIKNRKYSVIKKFDPIPPQMVSRPQLLSFRRQRQQAPHLEPQKTGKTSAHLPQPCRRRQSHRLVTSSTRSSRLRRRHRRSLHKILEHANPVANFFNRHGFASL